LATSLSGYSSTKKGATLARAKQPAVLQQVRRLKSEAGNLQKKLSPKNKDAKPSSGKCQRCVEYGYKMVDCPTVKSNCKRIGHSSGKGKQRKYCSKKKPRPRALL
jgi:hypothetical protein